MFFFFKQKTAYEMRISDWSSDVCSSDLMAFERLDAAQRKHEGARGVRPVGAERAIDREPRARMDLARRGEANFFLESAADERVTNEDQTLAQRHADAVRKFDR